jgi:deoxyribodipyrimidine photo-lyase
MNKNRIHSYREILSPIQGEIVYWMSRDQRIDTNWAFTYAQELANEHKLPLRIVFALSPVFLDATYRQFYFMIEGLKQVEKRAIELGIPFTLLLGDVPSSLLTFLNSKPIGAVITDFDPLAIKRIWKSKIMAETTMPFIEVDAHNIVPCRIVSQKIEFGAYTIRPKIKRMLDEYFEIPPEPSRHQFNTEIVGKTTNWDAVFASLQVSMKVLQSEVYLPGREEGLKTLDAFILQKIEGYGTLRNDPTKGMISNVSPYLHFGQLSAIECAVKAKQFETDFPESVGSFLEELIVRRELSDNFCFYNQNYATFEGFPDWAKKSLNEHRNDKREFLYTVEEFEECRTHDALWNAAQKEMVVTGKMHGYMRMYWAKKILEWTQTPEEAHSIALYLNDRYQLDGRDPNGYVGVAWSIGGVHDRAWFERPIYGKIRYMNYNGCASKFDVKKYIQLQNDMTLF